MGKISKAALNAGHILTDGDKIAFTSLEAAEGFMQRMLVLTTAMAEDISELIELPIDQVLTDYIQENDLSLMHAAFMSVLKKKGVNPQITATREAIQSLEDKLSDKKLRKRAEEYFGGFKCASQWDTDLKCKVYTITYPNRPDVVFTIVSRPEKKELTWTEICEEVRKREKQYIEDEC